MLRIAENAPEGEVFEPPNPFDEARKAREARKASRNKALSSLATPRGADGRAIPLRLLPWPQFLQRLEHKRDVVVRAHIRWCVNTAVRNCETLRRAEGRSFELRPGGNRNIVARGGAWHEGSNGLERLHRDDAYLILRHGRYLCELDENLRKLLCPDWAIPIAKRWVKIKLAQGWDLKLKELAQ